MRFVPAPGGERCRYGGLFGEHYAVYDRTVDRWWCEYCEEILVLAGPAWPWMVAMPVFVEEP